MTRIYLVRHAEASGNIEKKFHGHFDSELTPNGFKQLERLSERFKKIDLDVCFSSDLQRAKKTALAVLGTRSIPFFEEKELREINGGDVEDLYWDEIMKRYKDIHEMFISKPHMISLPNGESIMQLQDRIKNKIFDIVDNNKNKQICIASHGLAIRSFLCFVKGKELSKMGEMDIYKNTGVSVMEFSKNKIDIVLENDSSHLI